MSIMRNYRTLQRRFISSTLGWVFILLMTIGWMPVSADTAARIVQAADENLTGERMYAVSTMTIRRADRTLPVQKMESYTMRRDDGVDVGLTIYLEPKRMQGTAYLMIGDDVWVRFATTGRIRKLSSFAKKNATGGSDFSYADMGEGSGGIAENYRATLAGSEQVAGYDCHTIVLEPQPDHEDPPYPRMDAFVEKDTRLYRRIDFYQAGVVFKSLYLSDYTTESGKHYPLTAEMRNKVRDSTTTIETVRVEFGSSKVKPELFSVDYLERMGER